MAETIYDRVNDFSAVKVTLEKKKLEGGSLL
jgi:hypothetical protein